MSLSNHNNNSEMKTGAYIKITFLFFSVKLTDTSKDQQQLNNTVGRCSSGGFIRKVRDASLQRLHIEWHMRSVHAFSLDDAQPPMLFPV